ncbi:hypothetical protein [Polyangium aurulentum]|uniref:hypothetical protein n=1 Tax=Polyangium aurulentum TaxID=2567896 RepID=UPI0010AEC1F7|nr:hypothetical protein [Polyangium aurulentum]UQA62817.1 hypothetical protein E8A73_021140 [Polyangium aurulentum]
MIESPLFRASLFLGIAAIAACASTPVAQTPEPSEAKAETGGTAEVLFDEGVALADAGKLEEACKKFEASERLEHAPGTLLNLADCYEKTQRFSSAFEAYNKVAVESREAGKTARAQEARSRADALKPRISKLVIDLAPDVAAVPGLVVKRNGTLVASPLWGQSVPVDAGEQTITVSAPGKAPWRETIAVREAETATVSVKTLEDPKMPAQKIGAIAAGGVGVAGVVVGSVFGLLAMSKWSDAVDACKGPDSSPTSCSTPKGVTDASALGSEANGLATISTVGFVLGGAGLAAAGILWFTAPRDAPPASAWRVVPVVGPAGVGGVVQRSF